MIKNFGIKNFKGFNQQADIDLTRINLFFGVNSAGKSSIIDAFRMVQHSGPFSLYTYNENLDFDIGDPVDIMNTDNYLSYSAGCKINKNFYKIKKEFQLVKEVQKDHTKDDLLFIENIELICNNKSFVKYKFSKNEAYGENVTKKRVRTVALTKSNVKITYINNDNIFWKDFVKKILNDKNYKLLRTLLNNSISQKSNNTSSKGDPFHEINLERLLNFRDNLTKWKNVLENIATIALSSKTNIDITKIKNAELNKDDFKKIAKASKELGSLNDLILNPDDFTLTEAIISYFEKDIINNFEAKSSDYVSDIPEDYNLETENKTLYELINLYIDPGDLLNDFIYLTNTIIERTDMYFKQIEFIPVLKNYKRNYEIRGRVSRSGTFNSTKRIIDDLSEETELLKKINDWFMNSSIKSSFKIIETGYYKKLVVIDHTKKNPKPINIVDAGSGLRQLLPIIMTMFTQDFEREENPQRYPVNITLEEPEANLHPKLQIDLANLIGKMVSSITIDNFIIETHSEHMMLAFQKLIREKKLSSHQINVNCVVKDEEGHYIYRMEMNENGDFVTEWPQGFFDERLDLIR
tara:strand:+ start:283 stop:2019 length:1737 start_codon:yes stop_codon:yes gene_type:complete